MFGKLRLCACGVMELDKLDMLTFAKIMLDTNLNPDSLLQPRRLYRQWTNIWHGTLQKCVSGLALYYMPADGYN